ncbi:MFS transporter [Microbacterium marinilacus]|uniref:MFS transporter n=1 Tax=Microbacterium marinilacus TaxID=415209 RepID=A0ABP7BKU7_9MICO|nr:MFS transporter [Microbacterium marinilacus]MBY0689721.1 MFS transporter [Microbacterium marinilacus]
MSTAAPAPSKMRVAVAVAIGNFMEWFDFAVYGFFAVIIGQLFFPEDTDPFVAILSSLAVFAVGFFMRPLGGFILGPIGDRYGRRTALAISVLAMGIATTIIGLLPVYSVAGILAPMLLVLCRCVQGLSAGGEWTGSAAYLIESTPTPHRGKFGSVISATAALATIVGSLFALTLNNVLSEEDLLAWGWRVPFLLAAPLALIGLYIRMRLGETPVYQQVEAQGEVQKSPILRSLRQNMRPILLTLAIAAVQGTGFYYLATYVVNYLTTTVGLERGSALSLSAIGLTVYMILCPIAGALSDRFGRRRLNIIGTIGYIVLPIPVFWMMSSGQAMPVVIGIILLTMTQSLVSVTTVVMLVELFPASNRSSASAIGFNIALAFIAGPAAYIGMWLAGTTGDPVSPSWYMVLLAVLALPFLWRWLPETAGRDITSEHEAVRGHEPVTAPATRDGVGA